MFQLCEFSWNLKKYKTTLCCDSTKCLICIWTLNNLNKQYFENWPKFAHFLSSTTTTIQTEFSSHILSAWEIKEQNLNMQQSDDVSYLFMLISTGSLWWENSLRSLCFVSSEKCWNKTNIITSNPPSLSDINVVWAVGSAHRTHRNFVAEALEEAEYPVSFSNTWIISNTVEIFSSHHVWKALCMLWHQSKNT